MRVKSRGLGKGLDLLLNGNGTDVRQGAGVTKILITEISPNPFQPRQAFTENSLEDLAQSIRTRGVLQPILVRLRPGENSGYEIVAGERRWRASQRAGLKSIPALVRDLDDRETLAIALIENLQREDLNPIEEAFGLQRVKKEMGISQEDLARQVGRSRSAVANSMRLLQLPGEIQDAVKEKQISAGHARTYLALETKELQMSVHTQVVARQLNVRQTEMLVRQMAAGQTNTPLRTKDPDDVKIFRKQCKADLEKCMGKREGLGVRVSGSPSKGAITFSYATQEERERVLTIMQHGVGLITHEE